MRFLSKTAMAVTAFSLAALLGGIAALAREIAPSPVSTAPRASTLAPTSEKDSSPASPRRASGPAVRPSALEPLRDPTQTSPENWDLLAPAKPQDKDAEMPTVVLRGRIIGGARAPMATLEVEKQFVMVQQGSEITVQGPRRGSQVLRVIELTDNQIRIVVSRQGRSDPSARAASAGQNDRTLVLH